MYILIIYGVSYRWKRYKKKILGVHYEMKIHIRRQKELFVLFFWLNIKFQSWNIEKFFFKFNIKKRHFSIHHFIMLHCTVAPQLTHSYICPLMTFWNKINIILGVQNFFREKIYGCAKSLIYWIFIMNNNKSYHIQNIKVLNVIVICSLVLICFFFLINW